MCLGIPGLIVGPVDESAQSATVDVSGVRRAVSTALLNGTPIGDGDWVLVHVGFAMSVIDEAEAAATVEALRRLGDVYDEEVAAFAGDIPEDLPATAEGVR
ncbi:MAG: HypC/HybG/HupF family hydrogenase formation chaperone [Mobilicoccus sp.]|nr:HypC/HybG/HupF family hydrogenase formation chaperone [Mobilicoccus sp.]